MTARFGIGVLLAILWIISAAAVVAYAILFGGDGPLAHASTESKIVAFLVTVGLVTAVFLATVPDRSESFQPSRSATAAPGEDDLPVQPPAVPLPAQSGDAGDRWAGVPLDEDVA